MNYLHFTIKALLQLLMTIVVCYFVLQPLFKKQDNFCEMTYMFEPPMYIPIKLKNFVSSAYSHYKLYVYGEGWYGNQLSRGVFNGIPVLFIPGNDGSFKQVRSFASVAYQRAKKEKLHFDFFTVHLNEEISAFYGPSLELQTEFVGHCIEHILYLYEKTHYKSVILIGHSMGGLIARAVLFLPNITSDDISLIVTFATPHNMPVILMDSATKLFYDKVSTNWNNSLRKYSENIVFISIGGGYNDFQVSSWYTNEKLADISSVMQAVPSCWISTDHLAVVWCKQLVLALVRALFDSAVFFDKWHTNETKTNIAKVFKYHFVKKYGPKYYTSHVSKGLTKFVSSEVQEIFGKNFVFSSVYLDKKMYFKFSLNEVAERALIQSEGFNSIDWLFACKLTIKNKCEEEENLSNFANTVPSERRLVELHLQSLSKKNFNCFIIKLSPVYDKVSVRVDIFDSSENYLFFELPSILLFYKRLFLASIPSNASTYAFYVHGMNDTYSSYDIVLRLNADCDQSSFNYVALASSNNSFVQHVLSKREENQLVYFTLSNLHAPAKVILLLNHVCSHSVSVQVNIARTLQSFLQLYGSHIPSYLACQLLLILSYQLKAFNRDKYCPTVLSLSCSLTPFCAVPLIKIVSLICWYLGIHDDFSEMAKFEIYFTFLPLALFCLTLPLLIILCLVTWIAIVSCGKIMHSFISKVFRRSFGYGEWIGEYVVIGILKLPIFLFMIASAVSYSTCGTFGIIISLTVFLVKIFKQHEDYLESLLHCVQRESSLQDNRPNQLLSSINFSITIFLLSSLVTCLNLPSLIMWRKLSSSDSRLRNDPSSLVATFLILSICLLCKKNLPYPTIKYYKVLANICYGMAAMSPVFASINMFKISYIITTAIFVVALHQSIMPCTNYIQAPEKDEKSLYMAYKHQSSHSSTSDTEYSSD